MQHRSRLQKEQDKFKQKEKKENAGDSPQKQLGSPSKNKSPAKAHAPSAVSILGKRRLNDYCDYWESFGALDSSLLKKHESQLMRDKEAARKERAAELSKQQAVQK